MTTHTSLPTIDTEGSITDIGAVVRGFDPDTTGLNYASIEQTYATTLDADGVPAMQFVSIPLRSLAGQVTDRSFVEMTPFNQAMVITVACLQACDLDKFEIRQFFPVELPSVLWQCMTELDRPWPDGERADWSDEDRRLAEFAEYLAFADLVPFEMSAQQSRSLSKLMAAGATLGTGLGAVAAGAKAGVVGGLVIGAGGGPLIFITTPAGFVLGGLLGAVTAKFGKKIYEGKPKKA